MVDLATVPLAIKFPCPLLRRLVAGISKSPEFDASNSMTLHFPAAARRAFCKTAFSTPGAYRTSKWVVRPTFQRWWNPWRPSSFFVEGIPLHLSQHSLGQCALMRLKKGQFLFSRHPNGSRQQKAAFPSVK
jgi:hypothetical protein